MPKGDSELHEDRPQPVGGTASLADGLCEADAFHAQAEGCANSQVITQVGLWEFDPKTGHGSWTAEVAHIHEVDPSIQTSTRYGLQFFHGKYRKLLEASIDRAINAGQPYDLELELVTAKGNLKWVRTRCQPIIHNGEVIRLHGAIQEITDRNGAELKRPHQCDLMQSYLDTAQIIIVALDPQGLITQINRRGCELFGESENALLGRNWFELALTQPYGLKTVYPLYRAAMTGALPPPQRFVSALTCSSGEQRIISWNTTLLRDKDRSIVGALSSGQDITEQENGRKAFQKNEEILQLFIQHAPVALAMFDRDMRYLAVSHRWLSDYGLENKDVLGCSHYEIFPEIPDAWKAGHRKALKGAVIRKEEDLFRRGDGRQQWINWEVVPWHESTGEIGGIILFTEDVTRKRDYLDEIDERETRYRAILETTTEGFMELGKDGRLIEVNSAFAELTGYTRDELIGMPVSELDVNEGPEEAAAHIQKIIETGHDRFETQLRTKDGGVWPVEVAVNYVPSHDDLYFAFVLDISKRKKAENQTQSYVKRLEASMEGTLLVVANMVEQRDPYTAGHERRVGIIASDIAKQMGWSEDKCRILRLAGLVHDIGKIGVPTEILAKPTRLSSLEFQLVQTHVERGYEILKDADIPAAVAEIIRQHHERMDGSGYPRGLTGEEILPEARVLAVADVLESMASHRPYRPALGLPAALKEIADHRSDKFDTEVVEALFELIIQKQYQIPD